MKERGRVKFFSAEKGFGFICRDSGPDVFVHINDVDEDPKILLDGQHVEFDLEKGAKGFKAKHVKVMPINEDTSPMESEN